VAVGLAVAGVAWAWMAVGDDRWSMRLDNLLVMFPMSLEAYRRLAAGSLPVWSHGLWGGYPLLADPVTATFYPPHWLAFLMTPAPHLGAFDLATALHLGWLAAGTTAFTRRLGAATVPAVVAGLFVVCGRQVQFWAHGFLPCIAALAWWPWAMLTADRLTQPGAAGRAIVLGSGALGAQVLAGYPEFALYNASLVGLWLLARPGALSLSRRLLRLMVLAVGAAACAAPQLLPTLIELRDTARAGVPPGADLVRLEVASMADVLDAFTPSMAWLGFAPLVLGVAAGGTSQGRLLLAFALGSALISTGPATPFHGWLQQVPPFAMFRGPLKYFTITELSLLWALPVGATVVQRLLGGRGPLVIAILLAGFATERMVALGTNHRATVQHPFREARLDELIAFVDEDLVGGAPELSATPPASLFVYATNASVGNLPMVAGLAHLRGGTTGLMTPRNIRLAAVPTTEVLLDLLGAQMVWSPGPSCRELQGFVPYRRSARGCLLRNLRWPPRYEMGRPFSSVTDEATLEAQAFTRRTIFDPLPILAGPEVIPPAAAGGSVAVAAYAPGAARLEVTSGAPGLLLVREAWKPGWRATIDGVTTAVHRAGGMFFAISLPAGTHLVEIAYVQPGLAIGLCCAGAWLAAVAITLLRARRARSVTPGY
jgi:Bacterial membrane protein YfhO